MKKIRSRYANTPFTIIELLVVIAIIGILASLLLPVIGKARRTSETLLCNVNLKNQGSGIYMQLDDNKDLFTPNYTDADLATKGYNGYSYYESGIFSEKEFGDYQVKIDDLYLNSHDTFICTESSQQENVFSYFKNYMFNMHLQGSGGDDNRSITELTDPAETAMVGEAAKNSWMVQYRTDNFKIRHVGRKINLLFADGHSASVKWTTLLSNPQWIAWDTANPSWSGGGFEFE